MAKKKDLPHFESLAPEYIGEIEITDQMLLGLKNTNQHVNSIGKIPRGTYGLLMAHFNHEGAFTGLWLDWEE